MELFAIFLESAKLEFHCTYITQPLKRQMNLRGAGSITHINVPARRVIVITVISEDSNVSNHCAGKIYNIIFVNVLSLLC